MEHYVFRFRLSKKDQQIKELMVDADSDSEAFRKATKRNLALDPKTFNYEKSTENNYIVFSHSNLKPNWKW